MANTINSTNNLTSTKIPQLYIRYFNPKIKANETITIRYYVSDSTQGEYLNKDDSKTFTTIVKIKDKTYNKTTKAGEYSIDIGSIATTGETYFSIQTIDDNGVASIEQFFDILIVNDSYNQVNNYNMTTADLSTYNITVGATANTTQAKANNTGLNNLFKAVENKGHNKITMLNKVYMLDYHSDKVVLPDHFTVDMNGATFKATQCNDINVSNLVDLKDCFDSHVKNGKLIGNYDGFDFEATKTNTNYNIPGEGLAVAEINGARYSSFENMEMGYSVGYNLGVFGGKLAGYVGTPGQLAFPNAYYINDQGNTVSSTTMSTTELIDISTLLDRGEIQCNVYLGYGGLALNKAELFFHFYDSQSAYKTTIKTRQYQVVKIPSGSKSMRITGFTPTTTSSGMTICHTGGATNCELINVKSYNTRTCAMHPGIYNHLLIKNCSFNYVADENEYKVTKLALDFEDGYENGKNLFFINNEVYNGTSALTIQRGFNCNVINCRNFGLDLRGHIKGANIKNNFFNDGSIYTTSFESQSHIKLHNNTFLKVLKFLKWDDTGDYSTIGLTKLDCKQNYQNNSNINVIIDKAVESSSGGEITPETLTISNIENMTQTEQTEFYIQYTTNIAVTKHEVSWDGGSTFYDKTSDVTASGTTYKFKHDNKGNAGTYQMAIRVTTAKGTAKTSNVFTVTLTSTSTPEPSTIGNMTYGKGVNQITHVIKDDAQCWATINPVTVEQGATYTLQMDATWTWAYAYDDNDKFVKELFTSTGNNNYKYTFTAPTTKIRYGCYDPGKYLTYCNLTKNSTALTISNIENITQSEKTEFYIAYSTNIAVVKHEVSWDGGSTFYDKTSDVEVSGTNYKFKHDNSGNEGTYNMAIRCTDEKGNTATSNIFTVTLVDTSKLTFTQHKRLDNGVIADTTDGTFYSTVEKREVIPGTSYTFNLNASNYICVCYYDSDGTYKDFACQQTSDNTVAKFAPTFAIPLGVKYIQVCATGYSNTPMTCTISNSLLYTDNSYIIDDFSTYYLNKSLWKNELGYIRNNELQRYSTNNTEIKDGILELQGKKDSEGTWTSASIITHGAFSFLYGKIEARMKVSTENGSFPAFWTMGDGFEYEYNEWGDHPCLGDYWAWCGEFDIMEYNYKEFTTGVFFNEKDQAGRIRTSNYDINEWHTFGMDWGTEGDLKFYYDGQLVTQTPATDNKAFHTPHYVMFDQAIGAAGGNPDSDCTAMTSYVDWVRYYPHSYDNLKLYAEDFDLYLVKDPSSKWCIRVKWNDNCINKAMSWSSNKSEALEVHSGYLNVKWQYGEATITCTSPSGVSKDITICINNYELSTVPTISNIANITQSEKTEFYIEYNTNVEVVKHEVSWDGGNTFYDKTSDVTSNGTNYKFKHDNSGSAGTYSMAIRVTDSNGNTKTSNVFTVTLTSTSTPTPVYELTSDTVFDGTSKYVDTGVKLFQTASDHTLFIDFDDYGASQNSLAHLFHCAYENADGDGLKVYYNNEDNHYYIIGNRQNTSDGTYESSWTLVGGQNNKIAISISKGVVSNIVINGATVAVTKNEYDMNDYSLILGAYQDVQGNKSKYWKGTIHACKVWNSAFTVAEMKELFGSSSGGGSGDGYRPGRTLIWEDDFTGTTLNRANWDYENNYSRPNEVQNYVAGTNNVWVENSNLVIKAKRESSNGKEWSSGCIHTDNKREFMYGRFEAKIKIPQTVGSFPAFWTLGGNYEEGNGITWPYCGEIDIMEHKYGYAWTTAGALYRTDLVWDNWDAKDLGRVDSGNIGSFDDYHVYAMEWTANKLDYYVDDRLIGHSDISDDSQWFMFHQPHYILLNQALGAAGGSVPSDMTEYTMYVDWVRVYAPEEAPSGGGTSNQIWFEDTSARSMGKWSKLGLILKFNESWNNKVVTWKSSNTDIATVCGGRVDSKGTAGSCVITATTLEGNEASITVNVS
jgi:beta-glucanase (GH16 family)